MRQKSEYCITSGEFARLCGTTRDTLRYYQKQRILVPRKNPENGYYYYSYAQMASFYFIKTFRELGCTAADIRNYLLAGEEARFDTFVDRQYEALLAQKAALEQKIAVIEVTRMLLDGIRRADVGQPLFVTLPDVMRLAVTPVHSQPAASAGDIMPDIRRHMEQCRTQKRHAFPMGASMGAADFVNGNYSYRQVFSFAGSKNVADATNIAGSKEITAVTAATDTVVLSGRRAVVYVCRDSDGAIADIYQRLTRFLEENNLCPQSDIYSLSIVNVIDPHEERRYLKYLFVCVG